MKNWFSHISATGYWDRIAEKAASSAAGLTGLLIFYLVARYLITFGVKKFSGPLARLNLDPVRARRLETLGSLVNSFLQISLTLLTLIMALQTVGVKVVPLITAAGVAGLAVGFGAQKLVRDVINGFFILLEDQFSVGETVTIGAVTGTVVDAGLRITRIQDSDGKLYTLANGDIVSVCNHSRSDLGASLEVAVDASADVQQTCRILDEVGLRISAEHHLAHPIRCEGLASFDARKVTFKMLGQAPPEKHDAILASLRQQVLAELHANNIPIV